MRASLWWLQSGVEGWRSLLDCGFSGCHWPRLLLVIESEGKIEGRLRCWWRWVRQWLNKKIAGEDKQWEQRWWIVNVNGVCKWGWPMVSVEIGAKYRLGYAIGKLGVSRGSGIDQGIRKVRGSVGGEGEGFELGFQRWGRKGRDLWTGRWERVEQNCVWCGKGYVQRRLRDDVGLRCECVRDDGCGAPVSCLCGAGKGTGCNWRNWISDGAVEEFSKTEKYLRGLLCGQWVWLHALVRRMMLPDANFIFQLKKN